MDNQIWSWVLAIVGATGTYFIGKKWKMGWVVLFVNEMLWSIYTAVTKQYGFFVAVVMYSAVYIKSYLEWRRDEQ